MNILWHSDLETGNEMVDNQHREIFRLLQRVLDVDAFSDRHEKVETTLRFLADYVVVHFAAEEKLMSEVNYPGKSIHTQQHINFTKEVLDFLERFAEEGSTISVSQSVNVLIFTWLDEHIKGSDKDLAAFCREKSVG